MSSNNDNNSSNGTGGSTANPTGIGKDDPSMVWWNPQKSIDIPGLAQQAARNAIDNLMGSTTELALVTYIDDGARAQLVTQRKSYDPNITDKLIKAWDADPSLVPPGQDPARIKQQQQDAMLIQEAADNVRQYLGWLDNTSLFREAMLAKATKEGVDSALVMVDSEVNTGARSTEAIKATADLRAELNSNAADASKQKKGKVAAEQKGAGDLAQVQSENEALRKEGDAMRLRIGQLEQAVAQGGGNLPPAPVDHPAAGQAGHRPVHKPALRPAGRTGNKPGHGGGSASGRRKNGR